MAQKINQEILEMTRLAVKRHYEEGVSYSSLAREWGWNVSTMQCRVNRNCRPEVLHYRNLVHKIAKEKLIEKSEAAEWMDKAFALGISRKSEAMDVFKVWLNKQMKLSEKRERPQNVRLLKKVFQRLRELEL